MNGYSVILLLFVCGPCAVAASLGAGELSAGASQHVTADMRLAVRASGTLGVAVDYFGVTGGTNGVAVDDADGIEPVDESLEFEFAIDSGLLELEVIWTRGELRLSGFASDPGASEGSYDAGTGTWSVFQSWTAGTAKSFGFANAASSAGQTLTFSVVDSANPGPQAAIVSLGYQAPAPPPGDVTLVADPGTVGQVIEHFGSSMLWTIDPTEGWPEETKEALALKLMSEAGGIGLSNLRFDFGGGDTGTGTQTSEPWSWRFPEAMKSTPTSPYDWTRREGQQWFLRRSVELEVEERTLAAISPPWWMTKSGRSYPDSSSGTTNLDPTKVGDFASYLADMLEHFKVNEGILFDVVSPVNEPEWGWEGGSQEGNRGTSADLRPIVTALHSELGSRGLLSETRISVGEHGMINSLLDDSYHQTYSGSNWNGGNNGSGLGKYREYLADLVSHPSMVGKVDPVAPYHSYFNDSVGILGGDLRTLLATNAAARGVGVVQSEYCILGSYGSVRDLQMEPARHVFRTIHKDLLEANAVGWSWWLSLSPHDYKDGLIYTDFDEISDTNPRLFDSKVLWALGHFSRFVRPGWKRIGSGGVDDLGGVMSTAWQSPDGREVVIVAANFGSSAMTAQLPATVTGQAGVIREWHPWVTDRGRSLRGESPVASSFLMPPMSMTTFVGHVTESTFRLRAVVDANDWSVVPGSDALLAATATWEDGRYAIPTLGAGNWVFEPVSWNPDGRLKAGRYWIRRESDGGFLGIAAGTGFSVEVTVGPVFSDGKQWDVSPSPGGELMITESESGRVLADGPLGAIAVRAGGGGVFAQRMDLPASFSWDDGLGNGAQAQFEMKTPRWAAVSATVGTERAVERVNVRSGQALPLLGGLGQTIFSLPGDPVALEVEPADGGVPWRFRLVPSDRDHVLSRDVMGEVELSLPKGNDPELWELVTPGGGRVMTGIEPGALCWIRAVGGTGCLEAEAGGVSSGTRVVVGPGSAPAANWIVVPTMGSQVRIEHPASGLVLNISGGTGLPILWPDAGVGNDRFHLDAIEDNPLRVHWSHALGSGLQQTVSPTVTTEYVAHGEKEGVLFSSSTVVVVQQTFAEWALRWHGAAVAPDDDLDGDGTPELLEYARGSNPLFEDGGLVWQELVEEVSGPTIVWQKNREALGQWTVELSTDLLEWEEAPVEALSETSDEISVEIDAAVEDRLYYRVRFVAGS